MNQEFSGLRSDNLQRPTDVVDLNKLFNQVLNRWHFFFISLFITLAGAWLYIRYTPPKYLVSSTILINQERNSNIPDAETILQGFGLRPGSQNIQNQILILSSWPLIDKVLDELPFDIEYYDRHDFSKTILYPDCPIFVVVDSMYHFSQDITFSIELIKGSVYRLKTEECEFFDLDTIIHFGENVEFYSSSIKILPDTRFWPKSGSLQKIFIVFHNREALIEDYRQRLKIETVSREGTIIKLSLAGQCKAKEIDYLNKLTGIFQENNLQKKNEEASRIIEFIEDQLVGVTDSLMITEKRLQRFRSRNKVMDISAQGQKIIDQAVRLQDEKARLILELNYYEYLGRYLEKENTQESPIVPASMGIDDPLLANLMQELITLQTEYMSSGIGDKNPLQAQLELRMKNTKKSLKETLNGAIKANKMALEENEQQIKQINSKPPGLPATELQLLGIERQFKLNDVLYTFLLEKRAEAQIQKASNSPDNELVEPARADFLPVSPNILMVFLFAFLLGIFIPFTFILFSNAFSLRISSDEDLKRITNLPLLGYILHYSKKSQNVVLEDLSSIVAENFRSLRTRMKFFTRDISSPLILVTSSAPCEGKSFIAFNLASAYSLTGEKTVLVGFDLRRPGLFNGLEIDKDIGVSTYLIGRDTPDQIIQPSGYPYLDFIPAGIIPPNPAELIASDKTETLFNYLKKNYKYIIVDSAPIGTVSDSYFLGIHADAIIHIIRHGKTLKAALQSTLLEAKSVGLKGIGILINDIRLRNSNYKYVFNYKYGYTGYKDKNHS